MSSFRRYEPFEPDEELSRSNSGKNYKRWLNPQFLAKGILFFWILAFGISMFWHRAGSHGPTERRDPAEPFPRADHTFLTSVPAFGYPALEYFGDLYRSVYSMYRRMLTSSAPEAIPTPRSVANDDAPKQEQPKPPAGVLAPSTPENHISLPSTESAPVTEPSESADIPSIDLATPGTGPVAIPAKAAQLPLTDEPQQALPDEARLGANAKMGKVAPVGLPGYEPAAVIPKSAVKHVYPEIEVISGSSEQQDQTPN